MEFGRCCSTCSKIVHSKPVLRMSSNQGCKIKWAMYEYVILIKVNPFGIWNQRLSFAILSAIRSRTNQMEIAMKLTVTNGTVIFFPKTAIGGGIFFVIRMRDIEVH